MNAFVIEQPPAAEIIIKVKAKAMKVVKVKAMKIVKTIMKAKAMKVVKAKAMKVLDATSFVFVLVIGELKLAACMICFHSLVLLHISVFKLLQLMMHFVVSNG